MTTEIIFAKMPIGRTINRLGIPDSRNRVNDNPNPKRKICTRKMW